MGLIVQCAWCGKTSAGSNGGSHPITHGICPSCADDFEHPSVVLADLLDEFPEPIFLVDSNARVQAANRAACQALGKPERQVEGRLGGEVIDCAYAELPGGCGKTVHCDGCTIRNSVKQTWSTGIAHCAVTAERPIAGRTGTSRRRFVISTEKFGKGVLLRIDETSEAP